MSTTIATHSGPFHADDVMATALIKTFYDPEVSVVRTRNPEQIDEADIVVDVGAIFDPEARRFDHHQASYEGTRSSAGMILDWLEETGMVKHSVSDTLRAEVMDYLDAVDTGRRAPASDVPCFPRIIDALNQPADEGDGFDVAFRGAVSFACAYLRGIIAAVDKIERARVVVRAAMERAEQTGKNVLFFDGYISWKQPYFENGGEEHPTEYVLFPGTDGSWRILAIPPRLGDFAQKHPLPATWAGLSDEELEQASGIPGAVFCHKNRFIAVFKTREGALRALRESNRLDRVTEPAR